MKRVIFFLLLAINLFAINCGDFTGEFKTYNGHYYAITGNKMSFQNAKNFAQANNGYLAVPNTLAENNFIKGIVGSNNEAWIGIYDPNYTQSLCFTNNCYSTSRSRFKTVQGTSLTFQNWDNTDIENQFMENDDTVDSMNKPIISLLGEHWALLSGNTGLWRDWGTHFFTGENPAIQKAMIEFDTKPTCYEAPSTVTGEITGRVCNSQVWDTILGVSDGTTAQCLSDVNNIEYCPQSLAQCGSSWDYENGYSVSNIGQVVDYTNKVSNTTTIYGISNNILQYRQQYWTGGNDSGWLVDSGWLNVDSNGYKVNGNINGDWEKLRISNNILQYRQQYWTGGNDSGWLVDSGWLNVDSNGYKVNGNINGDWEKLRIIQTCSSGYTNNITNCKKTTTTLACSSGYTETTGAETLKGQCKTNQNYTYYNYLCNNSGYTPINSGGNTGKTDPNASTTNTLTSDLNSSTPPLNNCKKERFTCLANAQRPCALVDNKMQCSPFPCVGSSDFENLGTVEGQNDKNNSGWNNEGSCAGQLYIFNGEDKRCRLKDKFFGLTGGGCCDKDKVFMGLIACKDNEKILAKKRNNDLCHYVGQYCSKKLKFLGCIQTSESYCCFSSKLGRIIHEQGRPQLGISWGSGDSPNCRGFTPDEFQKLDFSKLDFTEFAKDIQTKTTNFNNIGGFIQNKVQGFYQQ
jgi:conjugal transfer mating pair stabilization protein TraN